MTGYSGNFWKIWKNNYNDIIRKNNDDIFMNNYIIWIMEYILL